MEEIVIRHGCSEGPRSPTLADVERALADIETRQDQRPEFSIEYVSNWRRAVEEGRLVTHMLLEGRYITVSRFYPDDEAEPGGWCVMFCENDDRYVLARDSNTDTAFVEGSCCGGPLTIRANCVVPAELVLVAVGPYLSHRMKCEVSSWLPETKVYRHG